MAQILIETLGYTFFDIFAVTVHFLDKRIGRQCIFIGKSCQRPNHKPEYMFVTLCIFFFFFYTEEEKGFFFSLFLVF